MTQGIDPLKDTSVTVVFTVKSYKGVAVNTILLPKGNNIIHLILVKLFKLIEDCGKNQLPAIGTIGIDCQRSGLFAKRIGDILF